MPVAILRNEQDVRNAWKLFLKLENKSGETTHAYVEAVRKTVQELIANEVGKVKFSTQLALALATFMKNVLTSHGGWLPLKALQDDEELDNAFGGITLRTWLGNKNKKEMMQLIRHKLYPATHPDKNPDKQDDEHLKALFNLVVALMRGVEELNL